MMSFSELLILRHAERMEIPANSIGNEVRLTEYGKYATLEFAKNLRSPVIGISTSPILRCQQTAEIIANENHIELNRILIDSDLGDPGYFIENAKLAWSHWQEKGHQAVNEYLLTGNEEWLGFKNMNFAVADFQEKIRNHLTKSKRGVYIWVTHDTILASFSSRVLKKPLTINDWPQYLDYLSIKLNVNKLEYSYSNFNRLSLNV